MLNWTFEQAKEHKDKLEAHQAELSAKLSALSDEIAAKNPDLPRFGPMGLTPDYIKLSPEYRAAKKTYDAVFGELRRYNTWFTKKFKKEYIAFRDSERQRKLKENQEKR